ncbi:MAG: alpha/beta fold hydrolase [Trueperaceae bacterium]|nr:alpha/beta fold hydrolase [Trueperaceae bacterium]
MSDAPYEAVVPADGRRVGRALFVHGFAEHAGRYRPFAERLAAAGVETTLLDLPGHGRSPGPRGRIDDAEALVDRLAARLADLGRDGTPVAALGHSFGGALLLRAAQRPGHDTRIVAVTGPYLASALATPAWLLALVGAASRVAPGLRTRPVPSGTVSGVRDEVEAYDRDPLVDRGGVRLASLRELHALGPRVLADAARTRVPVVIVHGADDALAAVEGSRAFAAASGAAEVDLHVVPNGAHDLLHDVAATDVAARLLQAVRAAGVARPSGAAAPG